ncbi:Exonuclease mut-7 [Phytophthora boehmeriae]|uniref:Exonuclease mut-7 n=1 Tax=Phytophthora boehmeriae TaxID=109152 RepID=A0A8T1X2P4_9STRA|nr:Exonuclease mut-7 [Phytophthora boehmeriae]
MLPAFQRPRMPFVAHFALAYRVDTETLRAFCANLFKIKVGLAVHFMDCLKMKHLLPPPMVLEAVIKYKDFRAGDVFAKGDQDTQQEFIRMLINCNVQDKVIKKRLSLFKLQASEFPVYFERRKKATLRFLVYSSEFEQALEFVDGSEDLKLYACKMIIRHAGPNDPATKQFVFRSGLARYFPEIDISEEADKSFDDKEDLEPLGSCLSIIDAIGEANIIFVDTPVSLEACVAYLNTQPVIGFDSEWKAVHISTGPVNVPAQCSLLQLASREKAFVVDAIALYDNGNILAPIFQSPSIVKIGFDTKGDVKALRPFLTGGYASEHVMSMLVDLQSVTRKLPTPTSATQLLNVEGDKVNAAELIVNTEVASSGGETAVDGEKNDEVPLPTTKPRKWKKKRSKISKSDGGMKASRLGLTAVAEAYLGLPLDKRARMSDWERRPLTQAQLHYAALDAQVLVQIYYKMQELHPVDTFEAVVRKCTQSHIR